MPELPRDKEPPKIKTTTSAVEREGREEAMDDEEKILAGRPDVNLPALLTKDVQGG